MPRNKKTIWKKLPLSEYPAIDVKSERQVSKIKNETKTLNTTGKYNVKAALKNNPSRQKRRRTGKLEYSLQQQSPFEWSNIPYYAIELTLHVLSMIFPTTNYNQLKHIPPHCLPCTISLLYDYLFWKASLFLSSEFRAGHTLNAVDIENELFNDILYSTRFLNDYQREFISNYFKYMNELFSYYENQPWAHNCSAPNQECISHSILKCRLEIIELGCGHTIIQRNCGHSSIIESDYGNKVIKEHQCPEQKEPSTRISTSACHYESTMQPCDMNLKVQFPCSHLTIVPCHRLINFHGSVYFYPEPTDNFEGFETDGIPVKLIEPDAMFSESVKNFEIPARICTCSNFGIL